jgi:hypothetical protein
MSQLVYLFTAIFEDGPIIQQTPEDVSTSDTSKSAFYDVLQRAGELVAFILEGEGQRVGVDLQSGYFVVNGCVFMSGDPRIQPPQATEYHLIYFRRHTHRFNPQLEELDHEVEYVIGWQATIDGKNIQQTIAVR